MKKAPFELLLHTASHDNILTLTTECSTSCVFCSHHQNPPEVEAFFVDNLTEEQENCLIDFLDKRRKIIIGESSTRICEGEPFKYKNIIRVLAKLAEKYPDTSVQITTSGVLLTEEIIAFLKKIGNVELNISLNSCNAEGRRKLYGGRELMQAVEAIPVIKEYGIRFNGSIVAMPHLVGEQDIIDTITFLHVNGAETIRVFTPGYTRYTRGPVPPYDVRESLSALIKDVSKKVSVPVILEPPIIKDLNPIVEGVISRSPVFYAGVKRGDIILEVDGERTISRVDAFYKVYSAKNPVIKILRDGIEQELLIYKSKNSFSGLVQNYDIHPNTLIEIDRLLNKYKGKRILILTSEFAYNTISHFYKGREDIQIEFVKNNYFAGNIGCAGLLTLYDVSSHLKNLNVKPDVVFAPSIMFDRVGRDITGRHYTDCAEENKITIEIL